MPSSPQFVSITLGWLSFLTNEVGRVGNCQEEFFFVYFVKNSFISKCIPASLCNLLNYKDCWWGEGRITLGHLMRVDLQRIAGRGLQYVLLDPGNFPRVTGIW